MFKYLSVILLVIITLFSKQSAFASATLEDPLNTAWEQAHQIAAMRSQYLRGAINIIRSQEPEDISYKSLFFNIPTSLEAKITQDLENSCQIWSLFERTLNYYQDIPDRLVILELLLGEIARITYIADSDWSVHVINIGTLIHGDAFAVGTTASLHLGRPQFIDIRRKSGDLETYAIIPESNIATQCAYEDHLAWKQMWTILKTQKEDYSPTVDKNVIGKGGNIVDQFFNMLLSNKIIEGILLKLEKTSRDLEIVTQNELMRKRIFSIEDTVIRLPLVAPKTPEVDITSSLAAETTAELAEEEVSSIAATSLESLPPASEKLSAPEVAISEKDYKEEVQLDLPIATTTTLPGALPSARPRLSTSFIEKAFMFPKKLNAKGERAKAREKGLKANETAAAAGEDAESDAREEITPSKNFTLNKRHYKTLETILKNVTTRQPPKWEAFKNMIKALGGSTDDSAGNGSTDCFVGNGSFNIHTPHTKGDRMYWAQIKEFASPGLKRVGITLETVRQKNK